MNWKKLGQKITVALLAAMLCAGNISMAAHAADAWVNVEEEDVFQPAPEDVIQDWMLNWVIRGVTLDQSYKKEDYKPITPERFEGLKQFTFSAGTHPEAYPETLDIYVHSLEGFQYGKDL